MAKRQYSLLIIIILFISWKSSASSIEYIPSYTITKRSIDTSILTGNSAFHFLFRAPFGRKLMSAINVDVNGKTYSLKPDTNGRATLILPKGKYGIHTSTFDYEEIKIDTIISKSQEKIEIKVDFEMDDVPRPMKKPVIYVYSSKTMQVKIELDIIGKLDFTYPEYKSNWSFTANPTGDIVMNNKTYNYLFWEGSDVKYIAQYKYSEGYVVKTDTLLNFLENSLTSMGFNSKESQDFITFWYPQMVKNEFNKIQFIFNDACNDFAKINISPAPTNIYRMSMIWSDCSLENNITSKIQNFPVIKRDGLTIIEWGGVEIDQSVFESNIK